MHLLGLDQSSFELSQNPFIIPPIVRPTNRQRSTFVSLESYANLDASAHCRPPNASRRSTFHTQAIDPEAVTHPRHVHANTTVSSIHSRRCQHQPDAYYTSDDVFMHTRSYYPSRGDRHARGPNLAPVSSSNLLLQSPVHS